MKKALFIIDAQNDFCNTNGALNCENSQDAVDNIVKLLNNKKFDLICCTKDCHYGDYYSTKEGKHLPTKHCVNGTDGYRLNKDIYDALYNHAEWFCYDKEQFMLEPSDIDDIFDNTLDELKDLHEEYNEDDWEIYVCGFATDICVLNNALLLKQKFANLAEINVIENCCAGTSKDMHDKAIEIMKVNHINIV